MRFKSRPLPSAAKARSLFSAHAAKVISACLTTVIVSISVALIAYAIAALDWVNNYKRNGNGAIPIWFHNHTQYDNINNATWRNMFDYNPGALKMDDAYVELIAGILGTVTGLLLFALPLWLRDPRPMELRLPRRKTRRFELTKARATTTLDAFLVLLFLVVAVYVKTSYAHSGNPYESIYNIPDYHLNHTVNVVPGGMSYEKWTCGLVWEVSRGTSSPSYEQLHTQCQKARTNRHLLVPLLVLALVRLSLRPMEIVLGWMWNPVAEFLEWRKHTRDMREGRGTELHDARGKRVGDEEEGGHARDSVQEDDHAGGFVAELPGWRMSRAEMDGDAAVTEMPGAEGGRELDAGVAAVEKDAGGKT